MPDREEFMPSLKVDALFEPRSLGIVADSFEPQTHGGLALAALSHAAPSVPVMLVGPAPAGAPFRLAASLAELGDAPDLTLVTVPAEQAPPVLAELGRRGGRAAILTQHDQRDPDLRRRLRASAAENGLRLLGPGSLGIQVAERGLNASLLQQMPRAGGLAVATHSASMLAAIVNWAETRGIGLSAAISVGAGLDIELAELLDTLAVDPRTSAILLYLDRIEEPHRFASAARRSARGKPVIVLKAGRHASPSKASLWRVPPDQIYGAVFRRLGLVRVAHLADLFGAAEFLGHGNRARGDRVAIISNSGGLAALALDGVMEQGMELAQRDHAADAEHANQPVDLGSDAKPDDYARALHAALAHPEVDCVLVAHAENPFVAPLDVADAIAASVPAPSRFRAGKPVMVAWLAERSEAVPALRAHGIPVFATPADALNGLCLGLAHRRAQDELMQMPPDVSESFAPDPEAAQGLLERYLSEARQDLGGADAFAILQAYGIRVESGGTAPHLFVGLLDDAVFGPVIAVAPAEGDEAGVVALPPLDLLLARTLLARAPAPLRRHMGEGEEELALLLVQIAQLAADCADLRELRIGLWGDGPGWQAAGCRARLERTSQKGAGLPTGNPRFIIRPYPRELEGWLALKDGQRVRVRPIRPQDEALYPGFGACLDPEDVRLRFFSWIKEATHAFIARLTQIDYSREMAFAALHESEETLLGVGRIAADPEMESGEFAILVRSDLKGQGLGWGLMERLIEYGRSVGLKRITGEILRENTTMLRMCAGLGFRLEMSPGDASIVSATLELETGAAVPSNAVA
ncbi:MAG TPA: GNAT family N-acetyltransferase [Enterovirga sp.]|nr:GNAT family N-acetyltransferase [Enterovirga sp.]